MQHQNSSQCCKPLNHFFIACIINNPRWSRFNRKRKTPLMKNPIFYSSERTSTYEKRSIVHVVSWIMMRAPGSFSNESKSGSTIYICASRHIKAESLQACGLGTSRERSWRPKQRCHSVIFFYFIFFSPFRGHQKSSWRDICHHLRSRLISGKRRVLWDLSIVLLDSAVARWVTGWSARPEIRSTTTSRNLSHQETKGTTIKSCKWYCKQIIYLFTS